MLTQTKFIKLKDQLVNVNAIVKVDPPRSTVSGVDWYIRTVLSAEITPETFMQTFYASEQEAKTAYEDIVNQLCK